jgi:hypothetical protein
MRAMQKGGATMMGGTAYNKIRLNECLAGVM